MSAILKLLGGAWQWVGGAALAFLVGYIGYQYVDRGYKVSQAESTITALETQLTVERQAFDLALTAARANEKITVQYIDRIKTVRETGDTIIKEIPVYVKADDQCESLPSSWGVYHDSAASNTLPGTSGTADDPAARVDLSAAAGVVAENYTACRENTEQLIKLQQWVADRYADCSTLKKSASQNGL